MPDVRLPNGYYTVRELLHSQTFRLLGVILFIMMAGCEVDTRVTVDGKNPPTINLSGRGGITFLRVIAVSDPGEKNVDIDARPLWQIDPVNYPTWISDVPAITYGKVPRGFVQKIPEENKLPPALEEGRIYDVFVPAYSANGGKDQNYRQ